MDSIPTRCTDSGKVVDSRGIGFKTCKRWSFRGASDSFVGRVSILKPLYAQEFLRNADVVCDLALMRRG